MSNNVVTKEWMDANDAIIQQKLQPLSDVKITRTLPSEPQSWESLLTYTVNNETHSFKVGDEVRVPSENSSTGYVYYKLYAINNNVAVWDKVGVDTGENPLLASITVNLEAYVNSVKTSGSDLAGTVVTLSDGTDTTTATLEQGQLSVLFTNVIPMHDYTVSVAQVQGYSQPASQMITNLAFSASEVLTFPYYADEYTLTAVSNQTNDSTIAAVEATVSYGLVSPTAIGSYKVPQGTEVTVTFPDVTGYKKTVTNVGKAYTALYQTEVITVIISTEAEADITNATFTVKDGNNNTLGTGSSGNYVKVAYDTVYTVSGSVLSGYQVENISYTASQATRTCVLEYVEQTEGIYAYYSNGSLKGISKADSTAIGVAVISDTCSFIIGKTDPGTKTFGGNGIDLSAIGVVVDSNSATAQNDLKGITNTDRIIQRLGSGSAPAADWCRTQFSGKGYLGSFGEWKVAYDNKADVNAMMAAIGGTAIAEAVHWTSTLYNESVSLWVLNWGSGDINFYNRKTDHPVRAFCALTTSVTLTLSPTDGTAVSNKTIYVTDKTGDTQTLTTDSNGQATADIAVGDVEIRVSGYQTITKSVTTTAAMRAITVEFCTPTPGVYAYYSDGTLKSESAADSTAIGVAVITSSCSFVIDKRDTNSGNNIQFGGYNKDLTGTALITSDSPTARTDLIGEINTNKIIKACGGYYDSSNTITSAPAAEVCRAAFNGKGYMGSAGEWWIAYSNKANIASMLTKIGGNAMTNGSYWCSTHYNASTDSWRLYWYEGQMYYGRRDYNYYFVRAFCAL